MQERMDLLAATPVFGGLSEETIGFLTKLAQPMAVEAGYHFFREGEESQVMYVLQSGQVEIYKTWQSTSKALRIMNPGDCFGEMALVDLFPRSASALALESCEALQITAPALHALYQHDLEQFTMLQMNMGREISRRLRLIDDMLFRSLMGEPLPETTFRDLS
jgi:CRP/FNR family cyclic AMP-dependent transcriptional regulator